MRVFFTCAVSLAVSCGLAFGQTPASVSAFVTVSVKPAAPHGIRNFVGGPGSKTPGEISYTLASLEELLLRAYGLDDPKRISGPDWIGTERYDVIAKLPPGTTKEQLEKMLQNLLTERFKLAIHHQSKDVPAYDLVVAEGGLKLKESTASSATDTKASPERGNYPVLPDGSVPAMAIATGDGRAYLKARQEPPFVLARMLSGPAGRPVVDKTGVTQRYNFVLDFDLNQATGQRPKQAVGPLDDPAPSLFDALEQQLGLKLVDSKTAVDILVIDHAEKTPSAD